MDIVRCKFALASFLSKNSALDLFLHILVDACLLTNKEFALVAYTQQVFLAVVVGFQPVIQLGFLLTA